MMDIYNRVPVDKVAAIVVSKSSVESSEFRVGHKITSMAPLPTTQFIGPRHHDLTGRKVGRFTVVGCAVWRPKNWKTNTNNTRWVVRCSCGRYEMLTTKAVKKAHESNMCVECRRFKKL